MTLISIVVPVYNNAGSLSDLAARLRSLADRHPAETFEFIYVDDGSVDGSLDVLRAITQSDPRAAALRLSRNFGSNAAILAGMTQAQGDAVGYLAADLQDPPESYDAMIAAWRSGAEVVLAERADRSGDPPTSRLFATGFNSVLKRLAFPDLSPAGVGFFLVDRLVADTIVRSSEKNAHLTALVMWSGFRQTVVPYERAPRRHGESGWTFRRKVKYAIDSVVAFSYLPVRLASALGFLFALAGLLYAAVVLAARLTGRIPVEGFTALMIAVLVTSGIQLLMLGVVGEYLWRTLDESRGRPPFIVAEVVRSTQPPGG